MDGFLAPLKLSANQPPQFYRGGAAIAALRGATEQGHADPESHSPKFGPEDWVASATTMFGQQEAGLSRLPDGRLLRDAIRADPKSWLGARHARSFSDSPGLLVKLLDAGQRLPVHFHPSDVFAQRHFDSHFGKTEAWIVIGTYGEDPRVYAGFRQTYSTSVVAEWTRAQDAPSMLGALNDFSVQPGDTIYIPAGLPHAIGEGVFVVELQQPTDLSLTLEWRDFLSAPEKGHLGIGFETALSALDLSGWDAERLKTIVKHTGDPEGQRDLTDLLAPSSEKFFRAERLQPAPLLTLEPSFAVLVVLAGMGTLRTEHGSTLELSKGDTIVVPHGAGESTMESLSSETPREVLTVIRCRPPLSN
jgi:mannose-6-phosphate isomerase